MTEILYLSKKDIEAVGLTMKEIIDVLETMFREKGKGKVEMPYKPAIHPSDDSFINAMPAYIPKLQSAGVKWVSAYPGNQKKGLPYITGLIILNDPQTGIPIAIMDATWITAKRTGAATAVAAKYLARPDSSKVGIIACGVQGRSNLEALMSLFNVKQVKAYDIYTDVAKNYAREMGRLLNLDIEVVNSPKEAVVGLDMVVTSGPILKKPQPAIEAGWLGEGAFASSVDYGSYWQKELFHEVNILATDDVIQMNYYRDNGYFNHMPLVDTELGDIVAGKKPERQTDIERTMAINLGIGLADMATASLVYTKAREKGFGKFLSF